MSEAKLTLISGLSGSGITTAIHALEDLGFFCVDNLPPSLLPKLLKLARANKKYQQLVVGLDARGVGAQPEALELLESLERLKASGLQLQLIFMEASEQVLLRRFSVSRRPHPLHQLPLVEAIQRERLLMQAFREAATLIIDTSDSNVHECKALVSNYARGEEAPSLRISVTSFGFRHGVPQEADIVWDVRFLPNPYFDPALRPYSGQDAGVRDYVLQSAPTLRFLDHFLPLLDELLPAYEAEGKSYLTVAIGCTGGRHRSVALAERIALHLRQNSFQPKVRHRDINKEYQ